MASLVLLALCLVFSAAEYTSLVPVAPSEFTYGSWGSVWRNLSCTSDPSEICGEAFIAYDCSSSQVFISVRPNAGFSIDTSVDKHIFFAVDDLALIRAYDNDFSQSGGTYTANTILLQGRYDLYLSVMFAGHNTVVVTGDTTPKCLPDVTVNITGLPSIVQKGFEYNVVWTLENIGTPSALAVNVISRLTVTWGLRIVSFDIPGDLIRSVTDNEVIISLGDYMAAEGNGYVFNVVLAADDCDSEQSVVVHASAECDEPLENNQSGQRTYITSANVRATKSCPTSIVSGDVFNYTIVIKNAGTATALDVMAVDTLPVGVEYVGNDGAGVYNALFRRVTFTVSPALAAGDSVVYHLQAKVLATNGSLVNEIAVTTTSNECPPEEPNNMFCHTTVSAPDLSLEKTCPVEEQLFVERIYSFNLTLKNVGSAPAKNVVLKDQLPAVVAFVTGSRPVASNVGGLVTFETFPTVAPGEVIFVTYSVRVISPDGDVVNSAVVTSQSTESGDGANNKATCTRPVAKPDIAVTKSCPAKLVLGGTGSFQLTVSNLGVTPANSVVLKDVLPEGMVYDSVTPSTPAITVNGQTLTWNLGALTAQQVMNFTVNVKIANNAVSPLVNVASVTTTSTEGFLKDSNNAANCSSSLIYPDLAVVKKCPLANVAVGSTVTYEVVVSNIGTAAAINASVVDTLPAGVAFLNASIPAQQSGQVVTLQLGTIDAGKNVTVIITALVTATRGTLVNNVVVATVSAEGGLGASNNKDTCSNDAISSDIAVTKTCPTDFALGASRVYTLNVTNVGAVPAKSVVVVDTLPTGVTYLTANPPPSLTVGGVLSFNLGDVAPGASVVVLVTVMVNGYEQVSTFVNSVVVNTTSVEGGAVTENNVASCTNQLIWADVTISKDCPPVMKINRTAVYNLQASNVGTAVANSVVVRDQLPPEVVFVSAVPPPSLVRGNELVWEVASLTPSESVSIAVTVMVVGSEGSPINYATVETVSMEGGDGMTNNFADCASEILAPDLLVELECTSVVIAGKETDYAVTIRNLGNTTAEDVVVTNKLPSTVTFVSMVSGPEPTTGPDSVTNVLTWSIGDVLVGQVVVLKFTVYVKPLGEDFTSTVNNLVFVNSTTEEKEATRINNEARCIGAITYPDVEVYKFCPSSNLVAGKEYSYRIQVDNVGTAVAEGVTLVDILPAEMAFVSVVSPASPEVVVAGQRLFWAIGSMAPDESIVFTVRVRLTTAAFAGPLVNSVSVNTTGVEGGLKESNNNHSCGNRVVWADVAISKLCPENGGFLISGRTYTYDIEVVNNGKALAEDVVVVDTLPDGIEFVSSIPPPDTVDGQVLTYNIGNLSSLAIRTITVSATVVVTAGGPFVNTVAVTTTSTEGGEGTTDNHAQCQNSLSTADVAIIKVCPPNLVLGTTRNYTITVTNLGSAVADNVIVKDILPAGLSIVSAWPATVSSSPLTWEVGTLIPGASATIILSVSVYGVENVTTYTNFVEVTTSSVEDEQLTHNNNASCSNELTYADLEVVKACSATNAVAGQQTTFTITVRNIGAAAADHVQVVDTLPSSVTFVSSDVATTSVVGQTVTWQLEALTAGEVRNITVVALVNAVSGKINNKVRVELVGGTEGGLKETNNNANCTTNVAACDVSIVKQCSGELVLGSSGPFTLRISNLGSAPAADVVVTDVLPQGLVYLATVAGYEPATVDAATNTLTWSLGTLAPNANVLIIFNVTVNDLGGSDYTAAVVNTATVSTSSVEIPGGATNNEASCSTPIVWPDVEVHKRCPNNGEAMIAGKQYTYTLTVTNVGHAIARRVVLVDALPAGVEFFSVTPTSPAAVRSGSNITWAVGDLNQFASITFIITVNATNASVADNGVVNYAAATTTSLEGGYRTTNNIANCSNVVAFADLAIEKRCPGRTVDSGRQVVYEIVLANLGSAAAQNSAVVDTLPAGLVFVSSTPPATTVVGQVVTWNLGTVAAKQNLTFSVTATVEATSGSLNNLVKATTSTREGGAGVTNNEASCLVAVISPDLAIDKTCPAEFTLGSTQTYTLVVSNVGTATAANVVIKDTLPAGLTFNSSVPAPTFVFGNVLTWNLAELENSNEVTITITVVVVGVDSVIHYVNRAQVSTTTPEGFDGTRNNADQCESLLVYPDIAITKRCPATSLVSGQDASYILEITNIGSYTAENVVVYETLPGEVLFTSAFPEETTHDGQIVSWSLGSMVAGDVKSIHVVTRVISASGVATNVVRVNSTSVEGGFKQLNNQANCSNSIAATDIAITKQCPTDLTYGLSGTNNSYGVNGGSGFTQSAVPLSQFKLVVSNLGVAPAISVFVTDELPEPLEFVGASVQPLSVTGRVVVWSLGTVAVGGVIEITVSVRVGIYSTFPDTREGESIILTNIARVNTSTIEVLSTDTYNNNNNIAQCTTPLRWADLVVEKTCPAADSVAYNDVFSYVIVVRNLGTASAGNVVLVDTLPTGVRYESHLITNGVAISSNINGQVVTVNFGSVDSSANGTGVTITMKVRAITTTVDGTYVNNVALTTSTTEGGLKLANNAASCSHSVLIPVVELTGACPAGDIVEESENVFTFTVKNTGSGDAHDIILSAVITNALGVVSQSVTNGGVVVGGSNNFSISYALLAAGASSVVTITTMPTPVTNVSGCVIDLPSTFALSSTNPTKVIFSSTNNRTTCVQHPTTTDLSLVKTCPTSLAAGTTATYTMKVKNLGCGIARGVVVSDTLPEQLVFLAVDPVTVVSTLGTSTAASNTSLAANIVSIPLPDLVPGATATITFKATVVGYLGIVENRASVRTTTREVTEANNAGSCATNVSYADVALTKVCPDSMVFPARGAYSLTITNRGTRNAENVTITDTLSSDVNFHSVSPATTTFKTLENYRIVVISVGTLAPGQTKVYSISVQVKSSFPGGIVANSAVASTSTPEYDTVADNNNARCETYVAAPYST